MSFNPAFTGVGHATVNTPIAPSTSWWVGCPFVNWYERCRQEGARMAGSAGARWASALQHEHAEKFAPRSNGNGAWGTRVSL